MVCLYMYLTNHILFCDRTDRVTVVTEVVAVHVLITAIKHQAPRAFAKAIVMRRTPIPTIPSGVVER